MKIKTVSDLADALGGPKKFGEAIGVQKSVAGMMKARNRISPEHWRKTIAVCKKSGVKGINYDWFLDLLEGN